VDERRVISGILHFIKSGCRWSDCLDLQSSAERGVWERVFCELAARG
jgi:transposase